MKACKPAYNIAFSLPLLTASLFVLAASHAVALTNDQRIAAAAGTVTSNPACSSLTPFYWEIGDQNGVITSSTGTKSYGTGGTATWLYKTAPDPANTTLNIYSAGKLVFGAYVVQHRSGILSSSDLDYLRMESGYPGNGPDSMGYTFNDCNALQSVNSCFNAGNNNYQDPTSGTNTSYHHFNYGGGHFQAFAAQATGSGGLGLGSRFVGALATEINSVLGINSTFSYANPGPAGGAQSTANNYTAFLRAILTGQLNIKTLLGTSAVPTTDYPAGTPAVMTYSYTDPQTGQVVVKQQTLQWHYSLGHWVENDPADPIANDGAFSSPGAGGFYPWIDSGKQYYGVVARQVISNSSYIDSAQCGKLIRLAWTTGTIQTNPIPNPCTSC